MKIIKRKASSEEIEELGVKSWPTWSSDVQRFDWSYSDTETCYFLEGKAVIETDEGNIEIGKDDLVQFPRGLKCVWDVKEPVRKHYHFGDIKI